MFLITKERFKTALTFMNKENMLALLYKVSAILENDKNQRTFPRIFSQSILFSVTEFSTEIMRLLFFLNNLGEAIF